MISIVIPCYNQGPYIHEAINSCLNQTFKEIEIIVINDGSNDEVTNEILSSLSNNIVLVNHEKNKGLSAARNTGIKKAKFDFILTLDADDKLEYSFLSKTFALLTSDAKYAAVSTGVKRFGASEESYIPKGGGITNFMVGNSSSATALFKKDIVNKVGGYDENMQDGFEDWELYIRLTEAGYEIGIIEEELFYYRTKDVSMMNLSVTKSKEILSYIYNKHTDIINRNVKDIFIESNSSLQILALANRRSRKKLEDCNKEKYSSNFRITINKLLTKIGL